MEMFALQQSFRVTDVRSLEIHTRLRYGNITTEDAAFIRDTCTPAGNPTKASEFGADISIPHLATTNNEVDATWSILFTQRLVLSKRLLPSCPRHALAKGSTIIFARESKLVLISSAKHGLANGMACIGYTKLDGSPTADNNCLFVEPTNPGISCGWGEKLGEALRDGTIPARWKDGNVALAAQDIDDLVTELRRIVVVSYMSNFQQEDVKEPSKRGSFIPLRLAYSMTAHKAQGMSLGKVKFTPGGARSTGTTFTALTRSRLGFQDILIVSNGESNMTKFIANANARRLPQDDMRSIGVRIASMAALI